MKRDPNLIREILLLVEGTASLKKPLFSKTIQIEGYTEEQISDHIAMMIDGNLLKASDWSTFTQKKLHQRNWKITDLSYCGHDLLDNIRDMNTWNSVLVELKNNSSQASIDEIKALAASFVQQLLPFPPMG